MTSDDIRHRRWTKAELDAVRRIATRQAAGDDSGINYDEIPRLTEEQLAKMVLTNLMEAERTTHSR
jgi:hypothetical protein